MAATCGDNNEASTVMKQHAFPFGIALKMSEGVPELVIFDRSDPTAPMFHWCDADGMAALQLYASMVAGGKTITMRVGICHECQSEFNRVMSREQWEECCESWRAYLEQLMRWVRQIREIAPVCPNCPCGFEGLEGMCPCEHIFHIQCIDSEKHGEPVVVCACQVSAVHAHLDDPVLHQPLMEHVRVIREGDTEELVAVEVFGHRISIDTKTRTFRPCVAQLVDVKTLGYQELRLNGEVLARHTSRELMAGVTYALNSWLQREVSLPLRRRYFQRCRVTVLYYTNYVFVRPEEGPADTHQPEFVVYRDQMPDEPMKLNDVLYVRRDALKYVHGPAAASSSSSSEKPARLTGGRISVKVYPTETPVEMAKSLIAAMDRMSDCYTDPNGQHHHVSCRFDGAEGHTTLLEVFGTKTVLNNHAPTFQPLAAKAVETVGVSYVVWITGAKNSPHAIGQWCTLESAEHQANWLHLWLKKVNQERLRRFYERCEVLGLYPDTKEVGVRSSESAATAPSMILYEKDMPKQVLQVGMEVLVNRHLLDKARAPRPKKCCIPPTVPQKWDEEPALVVDEALRERYPFPFEWEVDAHVMEVRQIDSADIYRFGVNEHNGDHPRFYVSPKNGALRLVCNDQDGKHKLSCGEVPAEYVHRLHVLWAESARQMTEAARKMAMAKHAPILARYPCKAIYAPMEHESTSDVLRGTLSLAGRSFLVKDRRRSVWLNRLLVGHDPTDGDNSLTTLVLYLGARKMAMLWGGLTTCEANVLSSAIMAQLERINEMRAQRLCETAPDVVEDDMPPLVYADEDDDEDEESAATCNDISLKPGDCPAPIMEAAPSPPPEPPVVLQKQFTISEETIIMREINALAQRCTDTQTAERFIKEMLQARLGYTFSQNEQDVQATMNAVCNTAGLLPREDRDAFIYRAASHILGCDMHPSADAAASSLSSHSSCTCEHICRGCGGGDKPTDQPEVEGTVHTHTFSNGLRLDYDRVTRQLRLASPDFTVPVRDESMHLRVPEVDAVRKHDTVHIRLGFSVYRTSWKFVCYTHDGIQAELFAQELRDYLTEQCQAGLFD